MRRAAATLALMLSVAPAARGESALSLPLPSDLGELRAITRDLDGAPIGETRVSWRERDDGRFAIALVLEVDGRPRSELGAVLERTPAGRLRPLTQRARTLDPSGTARVEMQVDHTARKAVCRERGGKPREIALPERDRLAHAPMTLLFEPLVRGEADVVAFEFLLCRGQPRILEASAKVARHLPLAGSDGEAVEIQTRIELGFLISSLLSAVMPENAFWFHVSKDDADTAPRWLGYRTPLEPAGTEAIVTREGIDPAPFLP